MTPSHCIVFKGLEMSRALGDFSLKPQGMTAALMLSPEPEMTVTLRDLARDEFMIAASDGVWVRDG